MTYTTVEVLSAPTFQPVQMDPYRYGWRYVSHLLPDGTSVTDQVPLTLEQVLHPEEGDQVTHSDAHQRRRRYLCNVFEAQLTGQTDAVVLDDVRIAWDHPDLKPHGPDIAVILGVRARRNWSTFDVATEGVRPALIIEITSPETASIDRSSKLEEYDFAGVPLYVLVDTVTLRREPTLRLLAYTQTPGGYVVLPPDSSGRIWLEPVQLWLGIAAGEVVCYDGRGAALGDYRELAASLAAERHALAQAEGRIQALEAEIARLRDDTR